MLVIIVAIDSNNAIGNNNSLLWHISRDLKYFKSVTTSHPVIMGRNTFYSVGRPLPGRRNIVITTKGISQEDMQRALSSIKPASNTSFELSDNIDSIIAEAKKSDEEFFVMGGGKLYEALFNHADRLYITQIEAAAEKADTYFPKIESTQWRESSRSEKIYDNDNSLYFSFIIYDRV